MAISKNVIDTARFRIRRQFFDRQTGLIYESLAAIPRRLDLNQAAVHSFLRIGYVPGTATLFSGVDCLPGGCAIEIDGRDWRISQRDRIAPVTVPSSFDAAVEKAGELLTAAIHLAAERGTEFVVPLSGGMDSRALLAGLLEVVPPWKITTYTHGTFGASDFEIGNLVARKAGTRHVAIDLDQVAFTEHSLHTAALWSDANTDLAQPAVWARIREVIGNAHPHWTGFTGDGLGGSHFRAADGNASAAVQSYLREESIYYDWVPSGDDWAADRKIVSTETLYDDVLGRHEAIWFDNHVERYTAHHIFMNSFEFENPFMDRDFVSYMLSLPPEWRNGKRLFDTMVRRRFPRLFELPTKGGGWPSWGLRQSLWSLDNWSRRLAWRVLPSRFRHPMMSYLDFGTGLRSRPDLVKVSDDLLHGLSRRSVLDGDRVLTLLKQHRSGTKNHRYMLTLLMSLEVSIRAFVDQGGPRKV